MKDSQHTFFTRLSYEEVESIIFQQSQRTNINRFVEAIINGNMFKLRYTFLADRRTSFNCVFSGTITRFEEKNITGTLIEGKIEMLNIHEYYIIFYCVFFMFWLMIIISALIMDGFSDFLVYISIGFVIGLSPIFIMHRFGFTNAKDSKIYILNFITRKLQATPYGYNVKQQH